MIPSLRSVLVALVAFAAMEPMTYVIHRWVMHGPGLVWHRSHHAKRHTGWERNDWYPVVFASSTIVVMAIGALVPRVRLLLPIGAGITLYGMAYLFVHDVYIHQRLIRRLRRVEPLDHLADAHALHHRFGGEPYGMLLPVIPSRLRERAREPEPAAPPEAALVPIPHASGAQPTH